MNMFSKEEFIAIIVRDLEILKHIHSKILPGTENYRPTEKQRSILELVQYLGYSYKAGFDTLMKADGKVFETYREEGNTITIENFPEKINEQIEILKSGIGNMTEEELNASISLFGAPAMPRKFWMMELFLKSIIAYRTQLFLYIKATGNDKIGTSDLWMGMSSNS